MDKDKETASRQARDKQARHNKRMASTLHDCSSRLGDKGYRASNPLLVKRPARRAYPPIHPFRFPNGLALTRKRAALDGERTMGGEAQGCVRLCRAHEEGPVKHFAHPPFLRCYAQSLDRSETLANKFVAAVCEREFETCGLTVVSLSTSAAQRRSSSTQREKTRASAGSGRKRAPETRGCQQVISIVSALSSIEPTPVLS